MPWRVLQAVLWAKWMLGFCVWVFHNFFAGRRLRRKKGWEFEISSPGPTVFYNPRNRWVDHIRITLSSSWNLKAKKNAEKKRPPGDSIRDLLIPDRWRSPFQPLSSGHLYNHPKMGTSRITWLLFFCSVETGNFRSSTLLLWGVFALAKNQHVSPDSFSSRGVLISNLIVIFVFAESFSYSKSLQHVPLWVKGVNGKLYISLGVNQK